MVMLCPTFLARLSTSYSLLPWSCVPPWSLGSEMGPPFVPIGCWPLPELPLPGPLVAAAVRVADGLCGEAWGAADVVPLCSELLIDVGSVLMVLLAA